NHVTGEYSGKDHTDTTDNTKETITNQTLRQDIPRKDITDTYDGTKSGNEVTGKFVEDATTTNKITQKEKDTNQEPAKNLVLTVDLSETDKSSTTIHRDGNWIAQVYNENLTTTTDVDRTEDSKNQTLTDHVGFASHDVTTLVNRNTFGLVLTNSKVST